MKITDIRTTLLQVPFKSSYRDSRYFLPHYDMILVEIDTDEGITGTSYVTTPGYGVHVMRALIDTELRKIVLGEDPLFTEKIWEKMWWGTHYYGRSGIAIFGISTIDLALWDIKGKAVGKSLFHLLGGYRDKIPVYGSGGWLSLTQEELVAEALEYAERGFKGYKMKVGGPDGKEDLRRVAAVRKAIGDEMALMVDANQGWDYQTAVKMGKRLEDYNVFWMEEPLPPDDIEGSARIAERLDIAVAAGEYAYTKNEFRKLIENRAIDVVQPDIHRAGGVTEFKKIADLAATWNLPIAPHAKMELHIQLLGAIPNAIFVEYFPWLDSLFAEQPSIHDGYMSVPMDRPGLGLEFSKETFARYKKA